MSEASPKGYFSLVLHCHLPYVRHPEHKQFLEEHWLFEAITETYLPLLEVVEGLAQDGISPRVTVSISPPLLEMLSDKLLQDRCGRYVSNRVQLMEEELEKKQGTQFEEAARMYLKHFRDIEDLYGHHAGELFLAGMRKLWREGHVELITSSATHALLPMMNTSGGIHAQLEQGCRCFDHHFGRRPEGFWLPECAWDEKLDKPLRECGLKYFFLESHGVLLAEPKPVHGVFAPIVTPEGLLAFGRDVETSKQVWSADEGYPGDVKYREFHRDLGYDAPYDDIEPYLDPWGDRHALGVKYHRVTGDVPMEEKKAYNPGEAQERASVHANHFVEERRDQVERLVSEMGQPPIITAPYDAELFGHWWFEGPAFLDAVFRELHTIPEIGTITPAEYADKNPVQQRARPAVSTWGYEGYFEVWLNDRNDWIYRALQKAEKEMMALVQRYFDASGLQEEALNQCARELFLAQSSDWPFLIQTEGAPDYAENRFEKHVAQFWDLVDEIESGKINQSKVKDMAVRDNIFPDIDFRIFAGNK